jgi:hypothetical protein
MARTDKTFKFVVGGRQITVSTERLKPAYRIEEGDNVNENYKSPVETIVPNTSASLPWTTRSGSIV